MAYSFDFKCVLLKHSILFIYSFISYKGSESPEKHFVYVWDNFISEAAAEKVVVVAHSYGGIVIVEGVSTCHCQGILFQCQIYFNSSQKLQLFS